MRKLAAKPRRKRGSETVANFAAPRLFSTAAAGAQNVLALFWQRG